jgi:hypothetical protein
MSAYTDLSSLRLRFGYLSTDLGIVPPEAWWIVERVYELSGYEHAAAVITGWRGAE